MQDQESSIVVAILRKDFPDVAALIDQRIKEQIPVNILTDLKLVGSIIEDFQNVFIHEQNKVVKWYQSKDRIWCRLSSDEYRLCKVTEIREMMIAVILMFYHPERLLGLTGENTRTKSGIVKELSKVCKCHKRDISTSLSNAIAYYKVYAGFKNEVNIIYDNVTTQGKYFI